MIILSLEIFMRDWIINLERNIARRIKDRQLKNGMKEEKRIKAKSLKARPRKRRYFVFNLETVY